jgi:NAD(P)-dependent dehydrogenase (short-subunit alcohol dehydrogenase family)
MINLTDKAAFVTGGASGIGLGIGEAFARAGMKVMLCDIEAAALETALAPLRAEGFDVAGVVADVSVKSDIEKAAQATIQRFGKVHVLVNNAGVLSSTEYGHWTAESWDWILGVNLMGVVWGFEIFGPLIESHGEGGHIVSTASVGGLYARHSMYSAYNVSKYGIVGISEALASTLGERNIGVSILIPGAVRSQIHSAARNLPDRIDGGLVGGPADEESRAFAEKMRNVVAQAVEPLYVGEIVIDAIEKNRRYVFVDCDHEEVLAERFSNIMGSFDDVRAFEKSKASPDS